MDNYSVVIVGYGPAGLVLASLLGEKGHQVLVLERWPRMYGKARLAHIDGETVRLLSNACDLDDAMRASNEIHSFKFFNKKGQKILDLVDIPLQPTGHPAHNSIYQPDIENALDVRTKSFPNVTVLQGYEVTAINVDKAAANGGATVTYKTPDGKSVTVATRFVFGADGANSTVRESMGIKRPESKFSERVLNIDGEFTGALPEKYEGTVQFCDPERGRMTMPIGSTRRRFEFSILSHEKSEDMENEAVAERLLKKYFGLDLSDMKIDRLIVYKFESRMTETWRRGPVFLGGDAVHTMPPSLGQGACSAIRDSANIAWKLDFVLRGLAPEAILETYETERRPHVAHIQKTAVMMAEIANTHNRFKAFVRDWIFRLNLLPKQPPFPPIGPGIKQDSTIETFKKWAGDVPAHGRVSVNGAENWFDIFAGYRFSIIAQSASLADLTNEQRAFLEAIGCNIFSLDADTSLPGVQNMTDIDERFTGFLKTTGATAMILRPDTNLFGLADGPEELSALIDQLWAKLQTPLNEQKVA